MGKQNALPQGSTLPQEAVQAWRQQLIQSILRALTAVGFLALVAASYNDYERGHGWTIPLYLVTYAILAVLAFWRRTPYILQAGGFLFLFYDLGVVSTVNFGLGGDGGIFLLISALAMLLLGWQWGVLTLVLCVLTMAVLGQAFSTGLLTVPVEKLMYNNTDLRSWLGTIAAFLMLGILLVLSQNYVFRRLLAALTRSHELTRELETDVTERKRAEQQAQARSRYLETLQRINATLRSTLPLDQVLETIARSAGEALGYVGALIVVPDAACERLVLGAMWGGRFLDAAVRFTGLPVGSFSLPIGTAENPMALAYRTGKLQSWSKAPERIVVGIEPPISPRLAAPIAQLMGAELAACVPLSVGNKIVGVLNVFSPREQLSDEEQGMLLGLADQAGLAIENARLYQAAQQELADRKRAEQVQAALYRISEAAQAAQNLDELFSSIHAIIGELMPAKNFYIALYDASADLIHFPYYADEFDTTPPPRKSNSGLTGYVLRTGKPLLATPEISEQLVQSGQVESFGTPSVDWLGVPLKTQRGDAIGVMTVQTYTETIRLREADKDVLVFVSTQVAMAIERKRAEAALRASEERYRRLVETSPDAITLTNLEGTILLCNQQSAALQGFEGAAEMVGRNAIEFVAPEDIQRAIENTQKTLQEGSVKNIEYTSVKADGARFPVELSASAILGADGQPQALLGVVRDITKRKRAEAALRESEQTARALLNATLDAVFLADLSGKVLTVNEQFARRFNRPAEELVGSQMDESAPPPVRQSRREHMHQVIQSRQPVRFEDERQGRWLENSFYPIVDEAGQVVKIAAYSRDITLRRRAEQVQSAIYRISEAAQSTQNLDELFGSIHAIVGELMPARNFYIALYDTTADVINFSYYTDEFDLKPPPYKHRRGRTDYVLRTGEPLLATPEVYEQLIRLGQVEPAGTPSVDWLGVPLKTQHDTIGVMAVQTYTQEARLREADKDVLVFVSTQVAMAIERKRAEEALRASEARYRRLFEDAVLGIFQSTPEGKAIAVNPAFARMFGYDSPQDVLARVKNVATDLFADPQRRSEIMRLMAERPDLRTFENLYRRQDGSTFPGSLHVWPVKDADGRLLQVEGFIEDITERKRADEALRRYAEQLKTLHQISQDLGVLRNLETLLYQIVERAVRFVHADRGGIYLYRPERQVLELTVRFRASAQRSGITLERGEGLAGKVWATGEPLIVDDYRNWPGQSPQWAGYEIYAIIGVPIKWGDEFLGVLNAQFDTPEGRFTSGDAELLSHFTSYAAIAIQNTRLWERMQQEIAERKQAENQVRQDAQAKARLLQEINHRVKNNLTSIIGLLYVEQRHAQDQTVSDYEAAMTHLASRIEGLAQAHDMLSAVEWAPLPLDELARRVIQVAFKALPGDKSVGMDVTSSPVRVTPQQANSLALVINELTMNTLKHALLERPIARIGMQIALDGETVVLEYRDDGPGYPEPVLNGEIHTLGLSLIQNIVQHDLRGQVTFHNDPGPVATFRFKHLALADEPKRKLLDQ